MTEFTPDTENFDREKLIYDNVFEELNRARDWPIKVMTFASAIYLALIGYVQISDTPLSSMQKLAIVIIFFLLWASTICIIIK